jgi:hypothetical protein
MKNNRSLQILVPFIVNKIEKSYDGVDEHSSVKKNLYLMVIDSLKILVYFITSAKVVDQSNHIDELVLRENAAKLLARLVEK